MRETRQSGSEGGVRLIPHPYPYVRLRRRENRTVEVRFCAVKSRAVSNRNCVAVMRGGEQRNENGQSETKDHRGVDQRELDSVGVSGRVC